MFISQPPKRVIGNGQICPDPNSGKDLPSRFGSGLEKTVKARATVATPAMPVMVESPDGGCQVLGRLAKWCDFAGLRVNRSNSLCLGITPEAITPIPVRSVRGEGLF